MFVTYTFCLPTNEGDPAEFIAAFDTAQPTWLDYDAAGVCNESIWMVPGIERE